MLKKTLITCATFALTTGIALANGAPYLGVSIGEVTNTTNTQNFRGAPLTFSAGYGGLVSQNMYFGLEALGVLGTASLNDNGLKTTYGYGLSVLPGLMLGEHTMTYARLGAVRSHFTPTGTGTRNRNVTGGQIGLGMQLGLTQNLDLRGEYTYTGYQSFSGVPSPKQDQFTLGLVYKLD